MKYEYAARDQSSVWYKLFCRSEMNDAFNLVLRNYSGPEQYCEKVEDAIVVASSFLKEIVDD